MCRCIAYVVSVRCLLLLDSADQFLHPRVAPLIEPSVGFRLLGLGEFHRLTAPTRGKRSREVFDVEGDLLAEVGFGADVSEVVRHVVKVGQRFFSVQNFLQLFSDFHRNASVVREVSSALATLRKRGEVVSLRGSFLANIRHSLGLGRSACEVHGSVGLAVLHRHKGHAAELHHLEDRNLVLHGHTMGQESSFVQKFLHFSSTFFLPGQHTLGTTSAPASSMPTALGGGV